MGQWTVFHPGALLLTFLSYALYHLARKTPSYVQSSLISEWTPAPAHLGLHTNKTSTTTTTSTTSACGSLFPSSQSAEEFLGLLNALFLFVYAAGNVLSGMLADRLDLRLFLTLGMTLSAGVMFLFGPVLQWTGGCSQAAYLVLQILNALFQSTGWPCLVPVMASWFNKESRGYLLGLWSSSSSVGSILGALILSEVVDHGYEYAFLMTSTMLFAGAIVVFFGLVTSPQEVNLPETVDSDGCFEEEDNAKSDDDYDDDATSNSEKRKLLGKTFLQKKGVAHNAAPYYTSDGVCTDEACGKFRHNACDITDLHSPAKRADTAQNSKEPTLTSITTTQESAQTVLSDIVTTMAVVPLELHCHGDEGSDAEFECNTRFSDSLDIKTHNHKHPTPKTHQDTRCTSPVDDPDQITITKDLDPERSFEPKPQAQVRALKERDRKGARQENAKAISFCQALLLPNVIIYSLCMACFKLVLYVFFFWLPFYLASSYGWSESTADRLALWYDVGGIAGATVSVFLMSRLHKTALVIVPMMVVSIPLLYVYGVLKLGKDITVNAVMLFVLGSLLSGLGNPLSAAVSADLSHRGGVKGSAKAMSTVTGILEGCGTVGAGVGQLLVPPLMAGFGRDSMFFFLMVAVFLSALFLLPVLISEIKDLVNGCKKR